MTLEKLYTVDDIAQMTMLTSRTIRNYLKSGLLKGKKVGGQWRFTEDDIRELFDSSTAQEDISNVHRQDVLDFLDGINTAVSGQLQLCSIVDYYGKAEDCYRVQEAVAALASDSPDHNTMYYHYNEEQEMARYTLFGTPAFLSKVMSLLQDEWHSIHHTHELFDHRSLYYDQYRPSYPEAAIQLIRSLTESEQPVIADIGSGTGKMSVLLLPQAQMLYAVEPNHEMRKVAETSLGEERNYKAINASAEVTGLAADSIDLIVIAEAYHWFDNEQSRLEFRRILKPEGYIVLVWNEFGPDAYSDEIKRITSNYHEKSAAITRDERADILFGRGNYDKKRFDNSMDQTFEQFFGGHMSASYAPSVNTETYKIFKSELETLFNEFSENGQIHSRITTVLYWGKLG